MQQHVITVETAKTVLTVVDQGLCSGVGPEGRDGKGIPGNMGVEAAVCYAMGLPHGDNPPCVAPSLRKLKIALNDAGWSSKGARAKGLRRLAIAQLGSAGEIDEKEFAKRVVLLTVRTYVPLALRAAASAHPEQAHKDALAKAAACCEKAEDSNAARAAAAAYVAADAAAYVAADAARAAYVAAYVAADAAAYVAAYVAADAAAAARAAARAADADAAAYVAAYVAADAAYAAYAAYAAARAARDKVLCDFAEGVVQILIEMKAPGCQWLALTETQL